MVLVGLYFELNTLIPLVSWSEYLEFWRC